MFAASSSGGMPPTNADVGSLQVENQCVPSDTQRPRNLQQPRVSAPSSTPQALGDSSNSLGTATATATIATAATAAAAAAAACPTAAASPLESSSPSLNQSTTTTRSGPPAKLGGDAGMNGVMTAFAGMGLPQAGPSSNPQPLPPPSPPPPQQQQQPQQQQPQPPQPPQQQQPQPPQQQQQQRQPWQQLQQQQQEEWHKQQLQQLQQWKQRQEEKQQQKQQKEKLRQWKQQERQQKQRYEQQQRQQDQQLRYQLQQKQEEQQKLKKRLQKQQQQLLRQEQQLLQQQQLLQLQKQQHQQQHQQHMQHQQHQPQQQKHKQQKQEQLQQQSPFSVKPVDLRLQIQASKLAFIASKRSGELIRAGFTLKREAGNGSIQEFLDRTRIGRKSYYGRGLFGFPPTRLGAGDDDAVGVGTDQDNPDNSGDSASAGPAHEQGKRGRDGGGAVGTGSSGDRLGGDNEEWRDMTFAYSEAMGWVFLHHTTKEGIDLVHELVRTTHGHEMGIFSLDDRATDTVQGFASALESCSDVSVVVKGAVVHICGTMRQVANVAKSIEAIVSGTTRMYASVGWYWRGEGAIAEHCPWFPMASEASAALETAFTSFQKGDSYNYNLARYIVSGISYEANFKLMAQVNEVTGMVRPIRRMVADRQSCPLPRCPKENMPLTNFREGSSYSLVAVTKEEDAMVRAAVGFTYSRYPVVKVEHVWNSFLWGHYAQNAKSVGNENLMFHGAGAEALNQICKTGFDRRLAGSKHGAKYGHGCYFASDASLAALYMKAPDCGQMIMAKVLVGEYTVGDNKMVKPPMMGDGAGDRAYDTTSDNVHSPQLIVTYKDWMAYPMYLITFNRDRRAT